MSAITIDSWDQNKKLDATCYPILELDAAKSLKAAWAQLLSAEPSIDSLALLFSQWALETGHGKACHSYNWGNIKSSPQDGYMWCEFRCNEIINGKEIFYDPPNIYCRFRAFKTAYDGAVNYVGFLSQKKGYANAWAEVLKGDPVNFCAQLKASHYFTADLSLYTKGVVSICNQFKAKYSNVDLSTHIVSPDDKPIEAFTPEEIAQIKVQLALSLDSQIQDYFTSSRVDNDENDFDNIDPTDNTYYTEVPSLWSKVKGVFGSKK